MSPVVCLDSNMLSERKGVQELWVVVGGGGDVNMDIKVSEDQGIGGSKAER